MNFQFKKVEKIFTVIDTFNMKDSARVMIKKKKKTGRIGTDLFRLVSPRLAGTVGF